MSEQINQTIAIEYDGKKFTILANGKAEETFEVPKPFFHIKGQKMNLDHKELSKIIGSEIIKLAIEALHNSQRPPKPPKPQS